MIHRTEIINLNLNFKGVLERRFLLLEGVDPKYARTFNDIGWLLITNVNYRNEMMVALL